MLFKKIIIIVFSTLLLSSCSEILHLIENKDITPILNNGDIAKGLKEALDNGVNKQVSKLTTEDGFFKNEGVKILMPNELKNVEQRLRTMGLNSLADEGVKLLNRAAEHAVKEAGPVFKEAIINMSFADVRGILMGHDSSATQYLIETTKENLYAKFHPIVQNSLNTVGADELWGTITNTYNAIPFITKINPDLSDYVSNQALLSVFKMITVEEKNIRTDLGSRTSDLLQRVFALQDSK